MLTRKVLHSVLLIRSETEIRAMVKASQRQGYNIINSKK